MNAGWIALRPARITRKLWGPRMVEGRPHLKETPLMLRTRIAACTLTVAVGAGAVAA